MLYVRISLMKPVPGQEGEVERLQDDLLAFYKDQPGFIAGYRLAAHDGTEDVARVTVWESEADADRVATADYNMAVRSELHAAIRAGHEDRGFEVVTAVAGKSPTGA